MRLKVSINAAGDMRLQTLADKPDMRVFKGCESTPLVCCSQLEELTDVKQKAGAAGFGELPKRKNFTRYAKRFVREAGATVDNIQRERVVFLTGTLPGSSLAAVEALARWSGWAVRTLKQWVRDTVDGAEFFGVWEFQRRGALHLHMCVAAPDVVAAKLIKQRWKKRWIRLIDSIGHRSKVDMYERADGGTWASKKWVTRTDAQTVEKSVANYLGKYLSKGAEAARRVCASPPSAWFFVSKGLRQEILESRKQLEISRLSASGSLRLFERLAAAVAEQECLAFLYRSPADLLQKGLIALMKPIQASMVFEKIKEQLFPLLHETSSLCVIPQDDIPNICRMFNSLRWVHT